MALGKRWLEEAVYSARSLKKHNPTLPVMLFSNEGPPDADVFDYVEPVRQDEHPFKLKIWAMMHSKFQKTLFLDTDTEIRGSVSDLFVVLDAFDVAIAGMRWVESPRGVPQLVAYEKPDHLTGRHVIYNTGVIAYRQSEGFRKFASDWYRRVAVNGKAQLNLDCDQRQFNDMVGEGLDLVHGMTIKKIPNTVYNCRTLFFKRLQKEGLYEQIVIVHEHGLNKSPIVKAFTNVKRYVRRNVRGFLSRFNKV